MKKLLTAVLILSIITAPLGNLSLAAENNAAKEVKIQEKVLHIEKQKKKETKAAKYDTLLSRKKELEAKKTLTKA